MPVVRAVRPDVVLVAVGCLSGEFSPLIPRASAQVVESTGFEPEDGWDAGYSICGPEFADTCSYPVTDVCVPNDHAANQNCCSLDPNPATGWYMADDSKHCNEPHIDTINPFSGSQHLRFQRDTATSGDITAFTPLLPLQPLERTIISFEMAGGPIGGSSLDFDCYSPGGSLTDAVRFEHTGDILVGTVTLLDSLVAGKWKPDGMYRTFKIDLDPIAETIRYCYGENVLVVTGLHRPRTIQRARFRATNWDIDDYTVHRGSSATRGCGEFVADCGPGQPCAVLRAVGINGIGTPPTGSVHTRPGDLLETEIHLGGWAPHLSGLRTYQTELRLWPWETAGKSGTVLPLGWDAPPVGIGCTTAADCPPEYSICSSIHGICTGPNHDPESGAFIATSGSDFVFYGLSGHFLARIASLSYAFAGILIESVGVSDIGQPRYAGTLLLVVSDDACGTFTFRFEDADTFMADPAPKPDVIYPWWRSLLVHVCEDDGLFCNGLESCESGTCVITPPPDCDDGNDCTDDSCDEEADACAHVVTCGACCDSWIGECEDAAAEADCNCQNCVWSGGEDCADIACEAEFVVIPTLSEWGMAILTLLLLISAKVHFGRASRTSNV